MLFEILNNIFIQIQKEKLHSKIIQLEKQLDTRQKLELEIQQLKGSLSVLKHIEDDDDVEVLKRVDDLHMGLREKEQALQDLESLNQTLIIKERKSNDELQEARKELINVSTFSGYIFAFQFTDSLYQFGRSSVQSVPGFQFFDT
jgi:predicted RND superfamily exporter protein